MSKKRRLEDAYRELQNNQAPDLWSRIEMGLEEDSETARIVEPIEKTHGRRRGPCAMAAAAACFVIILGAVYKNASLMERAGTAGEETRMEGASGMQETMAQETRAGASGMQETTAQETKAGASGMQETTAQETKAGPAGAQETRAEAAEGQADGFQSPSGSAGTHTPVSVSQAVWYSDLKVSGTEAALPPEEAVYVPEDSFYFTEEAIGNSDALCEVTVRDVSYEPETNGQGWEAVYRVDLENTLSSGGSLTESGELTVRSPLIDSGENRPLYLLKEGGRYVLPMTFDEDGWQLTFPYAPQIEVTEDGGYIFHTGWQSLVNEQTTVVKKEQQAPDDYYFDRMVYRQDDEFLSNLTILVEALQDTGRG